MGTIIYAFQPNGDCIIRNRYLNMNEWIMGKCVCSLVLMGLCMMGELASVFGATISPSSIFSSIIQERMALLVSGWWNDYRNSSDHCYWKGISCNEVGSVTAIDSWYIKTPSSQELLWIDKLNFTAFPNLVSLFLTGMGLKGSIPKEIGSLTNLTTLDLSNNRHQGKLLQFSWLHYPSQILSLENLIISFFLSSYCRFNTTPTWKLDTTADTISS